MKPTIRQFCSSSRAVIHREYVAKLIKSGLSEGQSDAILSVVSETLKKSDEKKIWTEEICFQNKMRDELKEMHSKLLALEVEFPRLIGQENTTKFEMMSSSWKTFMGVATFASLTIYRFYDKMPFSFF